ncbi:MAG: hypothetical protein AAF530_21615 [Pseudomonadota bacterium]
MKALIALIIVMGIAIIVALALVAYGIVSGAGTNKTSGFGDVALSMPAECRLAASHMSEDQLVLRFDGPAQKDCRRVFFIDPATGQTRGSLLFQEN